MADARDALNRLVDLQILSANQVEPVANALPAGAGLARLVEELLKRKLITEFQADAIKRGAPAELVYGGRFICRDELGHGGMGCVYRAWQPSMKRWVALKTIVFSGPQARSQTFRQQMKQRFQRELEAAGKLKHANIITVHDGGIEGDASYLAMEYIEGATLHSEVTRNGPRPWSQACEWIAQAAEGLAYAHEMKVVHRDIKPDNLMLTRRGAIKVLDLGLARFIDESDNLTQTASTMGTIDYMAPEQSEDAKRADARSDIYSLGCTLYFLCVGKAVFAHRDGTIPKIAAHGMEAPPKLRDGCKGAPAELEAIFQRMLRKRPEDRYQTMSEVVEALRKLANPPIPPPQPKPLPPPKPQPNPTPSRGLPGWAGAALALLAATVVILGLLLAVAVRRGAEDRDPALDPGPVAIGPGIEPKQSPVSSSKPLSPQPSANPSSRVQFDFARAGMAPLSPQPSANPSSPQTKASGGNDADTAKRSSMSVEKTAKSRLVDANGKSESKSKSIGSNGSNSSGKLAFEGSKAGEERSDNGLKMPMAWCPPGMFRMGSPPDEPDRSSDEGPVTVRLTRGFWIGKYEVTQEEWRQVMGTNPSLFSSSGGGKNEVKGMDTSRFPVETISWEDAMAFCRKWTEQERGAGRLPADWEYTLPTEAQWEYACRAGTTTATAFGDRLSSTQANFDGNSPYNGAAKGPFLKRTTEVGSYAGNAWGLCDMHGNVWEWCRDWKGELQAGDDPTGPASASFRVLRGGYWVNYGQFGRSSNRNSNTPSNRYYR